MERIALRTSLLPLLLPLLSVAAAVALASRWSALDPIQASIVERWTPLAALLGAAVIVAAGLHLDAGRRRRSVVLASSQYLALAVLLAVALVAPGESHIRLGWIYVAFVAASAAIAMYTVWYALPGLSDRRAALLLAAVALAVFLSIDPYHRAVQPTQSDEPQYLLITQSLQLDGDLDLANDYAGQRYRSFYEDTFSGVHAIQVGSRFYPDRKSTRLNSSHSS